VLNAPRLSRIYNVKSNEELDMLLAAAPVYNFARCRVLPLAEMSDPDTVLRKLEPPSR
jgi:muconolactone delta-isomerase